MKTFMVKYTEDFGTTYRTEIITADTFTEAYLKVNMRLSSDGAITDLFEVE